MSKNTKSFSECPMCGNPLMETDKFCSNCGQGNKSIRSSFLALIANFFEDYVAFDSKFFVTIIPLITNPGFLTLEFIRHRRSRYVSPIRLYLFISFVFFLVASLTSDPVDIIQDGQVNQDELITLKTDSVDISALAPRLDSIIAIDLDTIPEDERMETEIFQGIARLLKLPPKQRDDMLRSAIPVALVLAIPLLALILHILNWTNRRYYVDDVVFISHILSMVLLILLVLLPVELLLESRAITQIITFLGISAYFVIALRRVYNYSRTTAIVWGGVQLLIFTFVYMVSLLAVIFYVIYVNMISYY